MKISLGIVGLPNVGKSTLFNALTENEAQAENYPFCTIDPNVGIVPVKDIRLDKIAEIEKPEEVIPAVIEFYDIAGLVKGASSGEGLGNKFLANIRETSAIVHVVRMFENDDILHVEDSVDGVRDLETINTELILKDMETIDKRLASLEKQARREKELAKVVAHLQDLKSHLDQGRLAHELEFENELDTDLGNYRRELQLLTDKKVLYVINTEIDKAEESKAKLKSKIANAEILCLDIKLEAEIASLPPAERQEYMESFGLEITGLEALTQKAYRLLGLGSFLTAGPKEVRAWTFPLGYNAREAAGVIHTDFSKSFIAAEIVTAADFLEQGGWEGAKKAGKVRLEGKDYIMRDGDVVLFKVNP